MVIVAVVVEVAAVVMKLILSAFAVTLVADAAFIESIVLAVLAL